MKFGIIIQARTGSTRFPGKVLKKISGNKSVLNFQIERLLQVFNNKQIFIATTKLKSDKKICNLASNIKIKFFCGSKNDLLKRYFDCAKKYRVKNIVRITSDCPLVDPYLIKEMIKTFFKRKIDYIANTLPISRSTYPDGSDIEIFKFKALKKINKLTKNKSDREHVTNFFWKNEKLFKCHIIGLKKNLSSYRFCIDYKNDLTVIREIIEVLEKNNMSGSAIEITNILDKNKKIKKISKKNKIKFLKYRKDLTR